MSQRYQGGIVSATPPTTTGGSTGVGSASGEWTLESQLQAQAAGTWPDARNYIEDVFNTTVYTGNGTNNTSITTNVAIGSTQANTGGSVSLPGSTYIRFNSGAVSLSGDFTFECFVKPTTTSDMMVGSYGVTGNVQICRLNQTASGGVGSLTFYSNGTSIAGNASVSTGQWNHLAITRSGSTVYVLCNGLLVASGTFTSAFTFDMVGAFAFNGSVPYGVTPYYLNGSIASLRIISGTALYTSNYKIPSGPLPLVTNTVLLTFQGSNPLDTSGTGGYTWNTSPGGYSTSTDGAVITANGFGGMVWIKARTNPGGAIGAQNVLTDTVRARTTSLFSNTTDANTSISAINSFNINGFTLSSYADVNYSTAKFVAWSFREQPKFFDMVTYTGNGANRTIAHNLGSTPGCIIIKCTSTTSNWIVWHRGLSTPSTGYLTLNNTNAEANTAFMWNSTTPTATEFSLGTNINVNDSGKTFVAYLFAHNAGGFGTAGTDNVISCGSWTGDGSGNQNITLGWEPQWILTKSVTAGAGVTDWFIFDTMRGWPVGSAQKAYLQPNRSQTENTTSSLIQPTATGFNVNDTTGAGQSGITFIYIAIRRGPMKTPTSGTSVFTPVAYSGTAGSNTFTAGFPVDLSFYRNLSSTYGARWYDRVRGSSYVVVSSDTTSESNDGYILMDSMTGTYTNSSTASFNANGNTYVTEMFRRAPNFLDVVCYTGTGATLSVSHNLGVVPELIIFKRRDSASSWPVWRTATGTGTSFVYLNDASGDANQGTQILTATPTSTAMSVAAWGAVNGSGGTYVAYLFASCPGVSRVGSYTGTGATQTISCGFPVRFVLIKRTDSSGDWLYWDTSRGMVAGTDPRLALNLTTAQTNADWVLTNAVGFQIVTTDATVNASGGTYIYLAIA